MNPASLIRRLFVCAFLVCVCATTNACQSSVPTSKPNPAEAWKPLFNGKNLDGFYTYFPKLGQANDPHGNIRAENGMIHMMGIPLATDPQEIGYLCTEKSFANFDLRFQYKWGEKKFPPRATQPRDSGCLYLITGDDKVWPSCFEFQMLESNAGDLYALNNAYTFQTTVASLTDRQKIFDPAGSPWTLTGNRLQRSQTLDSLTDWNTLELIVQNNSATHIVNGKVVAHLINIATRAGNQPVPQGRIAFQCQAAEIFFRDIQIRFLPPAL